MICLTNAVNQMSDGYMICGLANAYTISFVIQITQI